MTNRQTRTMGRMIFSLLSSGGGVGFPSGAGVGLPSGDGVGLPSGAGVGLVVSSISV